MYLAGLYRYFSIRNIGKKLLLCTSILNSPLPVRIVVLDGDVTSAI
jgi:hypothetical protein